MGRILQKPTTENCLWLVAVVSREERAGDKKMGKFTPGKRRDGACNSFLSRTEDLMESMD